jgi:hypothetical protein
MNRTGRTGRRSLAVALLALIATPRTQAAVTWDISLDPSGALDAYASEIVSNLSAAGEEWSRRLLGSGRIEVMVDMDPSISTATGRSVTSSYVGHNGRMHVWEQGMAGEIRTGVDPNGAAYDVQISLSPSYLAFELWFDPAPGSGASAVPPGKTDAYSIFLHEIGHALGFNGWRDQMDGTLGTFGSTFDALTRFDGVETYFEGELAQQVYGGPVPLTRGNHFHVGNHFGRPGWDLQWDLMSGVRFDRGRRYEISDLDLAMMADIGVAIDFLSIPSPGSATLAVIALAGLSVRRRR